jgi:putative flavoprotein involved in K+ transport
MEMVETVVIGAGPAGLATSYELTRHGREHVVLEQAAAPADAWRNQRWDSFTLVTPNWTFRMPGIECGGSDPHGFMTRDEVVACFDRYVARFQLPVRCSSRVVAVRSVLAGGYRVETEAGTIETRNVVVATGLYQFPKIPPVANALSPDITQLHSGTYRNPEALPPGTVLVVGSAQSGCQIAEELYLSGRTVFLSTSRAGRMPRRYRGQDVFVWLDQVGFMDLTPEEMPPSLRKFGGNPHLSGTMGGHTLNLHNFARDDVTLLGHLRGGADDTLWFAPNLKDNLTRSDDAEREIRDLIDRYIQVHGLDAPEDELPQPRNGFAQPIVEALDLKKAGISTVIWAMGYGFDFGMVKLPVADGDGFPIQVRGVSRQPGLSFVGMPWMPSRRSGVLLGIGDAARHVATTIVQGSAPRQLRRPVVVV